MAIDGFFDAHVHADGLRDADVETLARFGVGRVLVCAHDGAVERRGEHATARAWLLHWERLLGPEAARLRRHGVRPLFAVGVHPAHAPWRGLEQLLHKLPDFLSDPAVAAIGVLGLARGHPRERDVLERQLALAAELRRPVVVAAPPLDPVRGAKRLAALLRGCEVPPGRVLVEQATAATLPVLHAFGFAVAVEASAGRLEADDIVSFVRRHGPDRLVATSHAGDGAADLLAVPGLVARLRDAGLSRAVIARVARGNAERFLGRESAAGRARTG